MNFQTNKTKKFLLVLKYFKTRRDSGADRKEDVRTGEVYQLHFADHLSAFLHPGKMLFVFHP